MIAFWQLATSAVGPAIMKTVQDIQSRPPRWRRLAAALVLRVLASCLRFAHTSRAVLDARLSTPRMEVWSVTRGKGRDRAGFKIALPTFLAAGANWPAELKAAIVHDIGQDAAGTFMVPDL